MASFLFSTLIFYSSDFNIGGMEVFQMVQHHVILVTMNSFSRFFLKHDFSFLSRGLDWSRQDSSISGLASRLPNGIYGLFDNQYLWPCSISDSNIGIMCIETNCDKRNYYKH